MEHIPLRQLVLGARPPKDRVFFFNIWFRGHNNPRYAELLPRLARLDRYLLVLPEGRLRRGASYRAWRATHGLSETAIFKAANRRYRNLFTTGNEHIGRFDGTVVSDVDDPTFSAREIGLLSRPNLAAYVVTSDRAAKRFQALGVTKPYRVVPQGVDLSSLQSSDIAAIAAQHRGSDEFVAGYMAAWLLSSGDAGGTNPLYNIDHLLELWTEIARRVPNAKLWLLGEPSDRIAAICEGRNDVELFGRVPRDQVLAYVANFHVGLYPRTKDQGIQAAKIAEYMGAGVPTVSYDFEVTQELRDTGGGVLVSTPRDFIAVVERLARDTAEREMIAAAARRAGAARDWSILARDYSRILDEFLPYERRS